MTDYLDAGAEISDCGHFRFRLWRRWGDGPPLLVIGLNPSTADATQDDPTIRRCVGFAKRWGYGALEMRNLLAWRATDPRALDGVFDPYGPGNLSAVASACLRVELAGGGVLAAWGDGGARWKWGIEAVRHCVFWEFSVGVACLGLAKSGQPRHPLYARADTAPVAYLGDGGRLVSERSAAPAVEETAS